MNDKTKRLIKRIVPRSVINLIRGVRQRVSCKFAPVIQVYDNVLISSLTDDKADYVGGYYDLSPFSKSGNQYLLLKLVNDKCADVILYDLENHTSRIINKTNAVNRQQGSRLRWNENNEKEYFFNDYIDGKYVTIQSSINSFEKRIIGPAFYDMKPDAFGLAINFSRLGHMRPGYGYLTTPYSPPNSDSDLLNEGIDYVVFEDKTITRLIHYYELINISGWSEKDIQRYYINHICLNPSGNRFSFFWIDSMDSDSNLKADLFVYDLTNHSLILLEDKLRVSHYAWKNDYEILVTVLDEHHMCTYVLYNVITSCSKKIDIDKLCVDGHPSWIDDRFFITDTYPDHYGYQTLFFIDSLFGRKKPLVKMYHTSKCVGEMRCDMHPRLSSNKKEIAFDGNIHGTRNVYILSIGDMKYEK